VYAWILSLVPSLQRTLFSLTLTCLSPIYLTQCDDSPPELRSAQEYLKLLRLTRLACILQVFTISWNGLCTGIHCHPMKYVALSFQLLSIGQELLLHTLFRSPAFIVHCCGWTILYHWTLSCHHPSVLKHAKLLLPPTPHLKRAAPDVSVSLYKYVPFKCLWQRQYR
jgi:hypothetical protein